MNELSPDDLYSLEEYARIRNDFREKVMAHKRLRRVPIGQHASLYFEDAMTVQYQVQEMLRIERIFEPDEIQAELNVYNPLVPDGSNWKATFMIEYTDVDERKAALARMIGIEKVLWVQVKDYDKVYAIANEDLERETPDKTSSVHFVRFELTPEMVESVKAKGEVRAGIDHKVYREETVISEEVCESLAEDLV